jgi:predicted RNase H-like HicB family nuclease
MAPKYRINVFWSKEDDAWVADLPDLRSCSAFGDTPAEALAELATVVEAWLAVTREDGFPPAMPLWCSSGASGPE